jgi:cell division protein FtsL
VSPAESRRQARLAAEAEGVVRRDALQTPSPQLAPEAPRPRHLHLVRTEERQRANRRHAAVAVVIGALAIVSMGLVALHVLIAEAQFRLDHLQAVAAVQQAQYERLRLDVAQLESPARIVSVAEGKIGMQQPGSVTYLPAISATGQGQGQSSGGARRGGAVGLEAESAGIVQVASNVPQGDADWPSIKPYLSGSP